ncbi:hypothetical protein [Microvirga splendida]|uniref:Uncharacterized protein n=1 Tax=Microvirga splendida TaxID=2795727 RepID=A0ABS0XVP1_9HYPH|nr:hypothetical protein [Microvirga splendida]MBJ6124122.1 hypothetical protein [Microvirga splendida]
MTDKNRNQDSTQDKNNAKDNKQTETDKTHQEELLDEAVEETFPASDPVAVKITK